MRTVALISGGKDSCFNMMHCVAHGHTITALANLYPPPLAGQDEMDSWMYQTVGHDVIDLYAEAMALPLFRQPIYGVNVEQSLHYNQAIGDETEDLFQLLSKVLESMPETQAISVGAIASNYQRLRVENVASRLGLTVLSYLWERDQTILLSEMISNGVEAILIKVACVGLTQKHLGLTLGQIQGRMSLLKDKYEVHPCGEGGEYETIVLDCPLFHKRLVITHKDIVPLEGDTAYLRLKAIVSEKKPFREDWQANLLLAGNLDAPFQNLLRTLVDLPVSSTLKQAISKNRSVNDLKESPIDSRKNHTLLSCNKYIQTSSSASLTALLPEDRKDVLFCALILNDMSDFATINEEYSKLWTLAHPPSRVCLSTPLPQGIKYILYTYSTIMPSSNIEIKQPLWVQSRSTWAPSNIGPYSQFTSSQGVAFISGQIGLLPASMVLASSVPEEMIWSMQSLSRIIKSQKVEQWSGVLICYLLDARWLQHAQMAFDVIFGGSNSNLSLLIVQLMKDSQLPRKANVEWQWIAAEPSSFARVVATLDRHSDQSQVVFAVSTDTPLSPSSHQMVLPVSSLRLNNIDHSRVAIDIHRQ